MRRLVPAAVLVVAFACGRAPESNERDVRVPIPEKNDALIDFVSPEAVIEPGEDKMICGVVQYDGDDIAFNAVDSLQGKFGHHVVLHAQLPTDDRPVGTVYECGKMTNFEPYAIPIDAITGGYGTSLPKGKKLIIQSHYLNTSEQPLRVRDVIRLSKIPVADVTKWMSVYAASDVGFELTPKSEGIKTTFDCTIPQDLELLGFGGHMHEWGTSFKAELGTPGGTMETLYDVPKWTAEYRDSPPFNLYQTAPKLLKQGQVLRTTCVWNNDSTRTMHFPDEMCAAFGVVGGIKTPVLCQVGTVR